MLYTKSIIKPKSLEDGLRISVMSRHTLNNGITPDPRITPNSYDEWFKDLAPSDSLIRDYYKQKFSWDLYKEKYLNFLKQKKISIKIKGLAKRTLRQNITLLCIEEDAEHCHRKLLAEECQRYEPSLEVEHR